MVFKVLLFFLICNFLHAPLSHDSFWLSSVWDSLRKLVIPLRIVITPLEVKREKGVFHIVWKILQWPVMSQRWRRHATSLAIYKLIFKNLMLFWAPKSRVMLLNDRNFKLLKIVLVFHLTWMNVDWVSIDLLIFPRFLHIFTCFMIFSFVKPSCYNLLFFLNGVVVFWRSLVSRKLAFHVCWFYQVSERSLVGDALVDGSCLRFSF